MWPEQLNISLRSLRMPFLDHDRLRGAYLRSSSWRWCRSSGLAGAGAQLWEIFGDKSERGERLTIVIAGGCDDLLVGCSTASSQMSQDKVEVTEQWARLCVLIRTCAKTWVRCALHRLQAPSPMYVAAKRFKAHSLPSIQYATFSFAEDSLCSHRESRTVQR